MRSTLPFEVVPRRQDILISVLPKMAFLAGVRISSR